VLGSETGLTLRQRTPWRSLEWRMDTLPFIDNPFRHIACSLLFLHHINRDASDPSRVSESMGTFAR